MEPIAVTKEQEQAQTPLLLLDFTFTDGSVRRWTTHAVSFSGLAYEARVLRHSLFEIQSMSEQGLDQIPRLSVILANADGAMSQLESSKSFKGATLLATFIFYDLAAGIAGPDSLVVFSGFCNPPDESSDVDLRVTAVNRMNMQRVVLPPVKIQRRCPFPFPVTAGEREAAAGDPNSPFYRCGYSPDVEGGSGRFESGTTPFTSCTWTRAACIQRGMFNHDGATTLAAAASTGTASILVNADIAAAGQVIDVAGAPDPLAGFGAQEEVAVTGSSGAGPFTYTIDPPLRRDHPAGENVGRPTRRFGGIEFVPEAIDVRAYGSPFFIKSPVQGSTARYNDPVPMVYGTAWVEPVITVLRNDGNLTRMEAVLSLGPISAVHRVIVNDIEIPPGISGRDLTGSGWYNVVTDGSPWGGFDLNFTDKQGNPQGDPYGSMAYLFIAVPNKLNDGRSVPRVQVLIDGRKVETFDSSGTSQGFSFTNNSAWVLLDLLKLARWPLAQMDLPSFAAAASVCAQIITGQDNSGNPLSVPRFQCNLVLKQRRTAAEVVAGVRNNARLFFTYSSTGKLQVKVEDTIARQQPEKPYGSNAAAPIAGGWPAYVYSDTNGTILRNSDGSSSLRVFHRSISDSPNRLAIEFQDSLNQYVQDSFALDDIDEQNAIGQEISQTLLVDGIPSFDQASRVAKFHLDKSVRGNTFVEFETSVKALGQQVGQIIAVSYAREGWTNQLFRILRIAPQQSYRVVRITAQMHDDAWYSDSNGNFGGAGRRPRQPRRNPRPPNPLVGTVARPDGDMDWGVAEDTSLETDGTGAVELEVAFAPPSNVTSSQVGAPSMDLVATVSTAGGAIAGGQTLYYRVTANDEAGTESAASFATRAVVPSGTNTNSVTLTGIRFDSATASFNVYRGATPTKMFRIRTGEPLAATFIDTSLVPSPLPLPDPFFDHANFYWKRRLSIPEYADVFSASTIGAAALQMQPDEWVGYEVRIAEGLGAGQVRVIATHNETTFTVSQDWVVTPDSTSLFFVEEPDWKFGSAATSPPASFRVPNVRDSVLLLQGRAADEQDIESAEGLAVVTAFTIAGIGSGGSDSGVPPAPVFGISVPRDGTLVLAPISFGVLENVSSISTGTFEVFYADDVNPVSTELAGTMDDVQTQVAVVSAAGLQAGDFIVVGQEALLVGTIVDNVLSVTRAQHGSPAAAHDAGSRVDRLRAAIYIYSFERGFFAGAESSHWTAAIPLPDVRITSVHLTVTNRFGDSPATTNNYLPMNSDPGMAGSLPGLRTSRGGQFTFQIDGALVLENDPVPALPAHLSASIRDMYALLGTPATGGPVQITIKRNGAAYQDLTIAANDTISASASGASLPPLQAGDLLSFDVVSIGTSEPGRDLTLVIRI